MNDVQREVLKTQIDLEQYHLQMLRKMVDEAVPNKQRKGWILTNEILEKWVRESESRLLALEEGL